MSAALADARDLRVTLQGVCEALVENLGVAFARLWTVDEAGTTLLLQASAGMYTHVDGPHGAVPVGKFKIGLIAEERLPHLTNDVPHDPRVGNPEWAAREMMVAFAGYPLLVDNKLIGVLAMFSRETLHDDTLSALASIADAIAQGIVRRRTEIELEQRVEELARSNADLEQFAYVASHDLQEPLRMISSYTQLLARRYKGKLDQDADDFVGFVVEGVMRMQRLINDLLAYSRVGTRGGDFAEIELDDVLKGVLANLQVAIAEANAEVTHDPLPRLRGDATQLGHVLQNLVGNAVKFCGDKAPRVHIAVRSDGGKWIVSVKDNGIGIEAEYFERIFVIFQRLHPREKYPGTGIGLAIAKKIIERHGGMIWVESKVGEGTTVSFSLPVRARKG
ncbi:MAG: ATP-binding protein [Myxococcota bacterium]|nr:ATP-binding protein [Myxococcota bacterium]